jgi:hypothetical protein
MRDWTMTSQLKDDNNFRLRRILDGSGTGASSQAKIGEAFSQSLSGLDETRFGRDRAARSTD